MEKKKDKGEWERRAGNGIHNIKAKFSTDDEGNKVKVEEKTINS